MGAQPALEAFPGELGPFATAPERPIGGGEDGGIIAVEPFVGEGGRGIAPPGGLGQGRVKRGQAGRGVSWWRAALAVLTAAAPVWVAAPSRVTTGRMPVASARHWVLAWTR